MASEKVPNYVGRVRLDADDIRRADSYIPIVKKSVIAMALAAMCVGKVEVKAEVGGQQESVPPLWQEDYVNKSLALAFVMTYYYLKMPDITEQYKGDTQPMLSANDFDRYGNIGVQLDRLKTKLRYDEGENCVSFRDKIYDLQADFRDFEKMLNGEIRNLLNRRNDICARMTAMVGTVAPEQMQQEMEILKAVMEERYVEKSIPDSSV